MTILNDIKRPKVNAEVPPRHIHAALAPNSSVEMPSRWRAEGLDALFSALSARHTAAMQTNALMQALGTVVAAAKADPGRDDRT